MFQPVGSQPPAVYWRRRLVVVVLPLVLVVLLLWALLGRGGDSRQSANASATSRSPTAPVPTSSAPRTTASRTKVGRSSTSASAVKACTLGDLQIQPATGKNAFAVNSRPDLYLVVTNVAAKPCRYDLADKQIELRIFTGDVRVWGSHDCQVAPGTDVATLPSRKAVRRGIVWSGQTSVPGCTGTRLVAQAGTYTLYAQLSGKQSGPVAFRLTG
ncbi:MAG: hypothetical protein ABJA87_12845 [bacterium]